jgi:diphthine-ammonia ligase
LSGKSNLQADCFAYKDSEKIDVMHVQGISYWAPANIGPYSQVKAAAGQVHVAGQIGLIPHSMEFPKESNELSQCTKEIEVSLENLRQIVKAWDLSIDQHCLGLVCYTSKPSFNAVAKAAWEVFSKVTIFMTHH